MNIPGFMRYERGDTVEPPALSRIEILPGMNIGQMRALPPGTEICIITIGFAGHGLKFSRGVIDDEWRLKMEEVIADENLGDDEELPGSVFMYLLPENYEPDVQEMLNEHFVRLGLRHGREGAPMTSVSQLQERNKDRWHDEAYASYVTAYKRGAEMRRKGR